MYLTEDVAAEKFFCAFYVMDKWIRAEVWLALAWCEESQWYNTFTLNWDV